jgi:multimeric flavodoxin WrbA
VDLEEKEDYTGWRLIYHLIIKMKKIVVIIGSSKKHGATRKAVDEMSDLLDFEVIDLNDYNISYYDYENNNKGDNYIELMKELIEKYDVFIFATPVYWYSMSGIMKVFFDRLTDLITIEKNTGRKLKGKSMAVVSSSNGNNLANSFWLPFSETANYLNINFIGGVHTIENEDNSSLLNQFVSTIKKN